MPEGWRPLDARRLMREHEDGFIIVKPIDEEHGIVPFDCPSCERRMRSQYDIAAFLEHGVCDRCYGPKKDGQLTPA